MSKQIATIPLGNISKLQIYINRGCKGLSVIKKETGADYVLNGGLFNPDWTACPLLKSDGAMQSKTTWRAYGFGWNRPEDISLRLDYENVSNFISCVCLLRGGKREKISVTSALDGARQRSAIGLMGDKLALYCTDEGTTPGALQRELEKLGCTDAVMLDGGGSSQCDFNGKQIKAARVVHNLLLVYTKKTGEAPEKGDKPVGKKIVCLDPGHGPSTVNGSPDGSYKEREFAWDMYTRVKPMLERQGITVVGTRTEDDMPSLTERARTANSAGADCFVSLHSNAAGNGGWYDARGLMIYTSAGPMTAARNVLAADLINAFHAAGVIVRSSPILHELYTVLVKTNAPACLIEYGFHTNREDAALLKDSAYRDKLARATAQGVCKYLGISWSEDSAEKPAADRQRVQERFGLADETMDYLEAYKYGADLLKKLAGGK